MATALLRDVQTKESNMANIQPNRYVMQSSDGKTKVDYETSSFIGQPTLNLTQGSGPVRHFTGSQIRTLNTEIGTLVSVTTQMTVDTGSTSVSVLIPSISLKTVSEQTTFSTEVIVTSHAGPNSLSSTGVQETYQFIPLKGEANFVLSLLEPVMGALAKAAANR
jgi:hypothetical protein